MFSTTATPGAAALLKHEQQQRIARRSDELRRAHLASEATGTDDERLVRRSLVRDWGGVFARRPRLAH